jgi:hypothetical protein
LKKLALLSFAALGIASLTQTASATSIAEQHGWTPVFTTIQRPVDMRAVFQGVRTGSTIQTWSSSIKSPLDHNTYDFTIVGTDPSKGAATTTIKYFPIAIKWHFPKGVVIDPTKPGCGDTVSVVNRFFQGPMFTNVANTSNGDTLPTTQTTDAFQIAEFWQYTQKESYHVLLAPQKNVITIVNETAPSGSVVQSGGCSGSGHDLGEIPIDGYDSILQALALKYTKSATILPVILSYNIVETEGGCCIIGYHSVVTNHGEPQPYATGAYTDPGIFPTGDQDIWAWQHEMGETFNDPYINNGTPAWGHIGQVSGCQNNLEVGDPLTGTNYALAENGFTYHPQELAFFSWFFRQKPSIGTGGKYSYKGTFTSAQGACN